MFISSIKTLARWRWLAVTLIAVSVVAIELVDRRASNFNDSAGGQALDILVYGAALPILGRVTLNRRRIVVVESGLLLGAGVLSLLSRDSELQVVGVTPHDEAALVEQIECCEPDVVVLDEATYLTEATKLLSLLADYPELRVIAVSANDDKVQVLDRHQVVVTRAADLITLIKG